MSKKVGGLKELYRGSSSDSGRSAQKTAKASSRTQGESGRFVAEGVDIHVTPGASGGWIVRRSGSERASKSFPTQPEAVRYAGSLAKRESIELYVHGRDGLVESHSVGGRDRKH